MTGTIATGTYRLRTLACFSWVAFGSCVAYIQTGYYLYWEAAE